MLVKEFKDGQWQVIDNGFGTYYADNQTRGMLKADGDTITTNNGVITCQKQKYAFNTELQYIYPGTYQWQVPDGVEFIKVLVIGGGSNGKKYASGVTSQYYACGAGAISALLKVTPKETIELEVGTNADGVALYDGRIQASKTILTKTDGQEGGTASFGTWITAPGGKRILYSNTENYSNATGTWKTRPDCTFTPRDLKYDRIISGFIWDIDTAGNRIAQIPKSIGTQDFALGASGSFDSNKYWRTLKAVCDNYQEDYTPSQVTNNLAWRGATSPKSGADGVDGFVYGGTGTISSNASNGTGFVKAGDCYALFGLGGNGSKGTDIVRTSNGGNALNFGGVGGVSGAAYSKNTVGASSGAGGPGGIFIWY